MKKKFYYLLALTSLFSLFSCSSNEPSNITSLQIGYNGSTSILEGSIVSLDQIVNGTIDNENKFVFFTTSNNDIAFVKNNNLYTKNVDKNEDIIVTLEDKYTHINSSLSFTILDSGYTINDEIESSNYSKDKTFITKSNEFNYFYDVKFENEFIFSQTINVQNVKEDSYFGYVLSQNKELNKDSILISLSKGNYVFNIEVFSYNTKNKSFSSLLYKNSYNYELVENEFLDYSLIRFNKGFKVIISSSTNTFSSNIIKIDSLDFSMFSYCSIIGKDIKLSIKDTKYSYELKDYIPKPLDILLTTTSAKVLINQTYQIDFTLEGDYLNYDLLFASSDTNVASISQNGLITAKKGGKATISISFKGTSIIKYFEIYVYRQNEIFNLDARNSETFFDKEIGQNYYEFTSNNKNSLAYIYGFRGTFGIYLYVEQYIVKTKNTGSNWYERDNIEFRISTYNNVSYQYWVSVLNNGSSNIVESKTTGLENCTLSNYSKYFRSEMFISYDNLKQALKEDVDYTFEFGLSVGINDSLGWKCNNGFNSTDLTTLPKIKEDGIYYSIL